MRRAPTRKFVDRNFQSLVRENAPRPNPLPEHFGAGAQKRSATSTTTRPATQPHAIQTDDGASKRRTPPFTDDLQPIQSVRQQPPAMPPSSTLSLRCVQRSTGRPMSALHSFSFTIVSAASNSVRRRSTRTRLDFGGKTFQRKLSMRSHLPQPGFFRARSLQHRPGMCLQFLGSDPCLSPLLVLSCLLSAFEIPAYSPPCNFCLHLLCLYGGRLCDVTVAMPFLSSFATQVRGRVSGVKRPKAEKADRAAVGIP